MDGEQFLDQLAGAVLDSEDVDWADAESSADESARPFIRHLRLVASVGQLHRRMQPPGPSASPGEGATGHWGHLRLIESIGRGAFGEVFRAWDTRLDREVALKLLPAEGRPLPSASSIIEEGRLLARVRHPNVVTIYGAERIDGRIGLWMELVNGRTLEEAMRGGARFTVIEVTRIGVELCGAVEAVHAAGLLHRDIKTQNVMVTEDGRPVLMDFGTGRERDTSDASVSGTPLYLAPEVLAGGAATAQSDVYSVGVLLYHLLTGSYPVRASSLADLRRAHASRQHADLPDTGQAIPNRLRRVVARALDPNPARRYPSADALGAALAASAQAPSRRLFAIAAATVVVAATAVWQFRPAAAVDPVIAVMPFKNLSSEPESDYF